jgi:protein-tyrosine phosphatase
MTAPDLFWIPGPWRGRLAMSTRPRGGDWLEDEVRAWHRSGIDIVVSLLEPAESEQLGLQQERRLVEANGLRFLSLPITDRGVPSSGKAAVSLLKDLTHALEEGKHVAVHCRQGIGRSGLIAAGALVASGATPEAALRTVSSARGLTVPETPEQRRWVEQLPVNESVTARR